MLFDRIQPVVDRRNALRTLEEIGQAGWEWRSDARGGFYGIREFGRVRRCQNDHRRAVPLRTGFGSGKTHGSMRVDQHSLLTI